MACGAPCLLISIKACLSYVDLLCHILLQSFKNDISICTCEPNLTVQTLRNTWLSVMLLSGYTASALSSKPQTVQVGVKGREVNVVSDETCKTLLVTSKNENMDLDEHNGCVCVCTPL